MEKNIESTRQLKVAKEIQKHMDFSREIAEKLGLSGDKNDEENK